MDLKSLLFPYDKIRPVQDELVKEIESALNNKHHLIVHAPTGLGKTAATIAPALAFAMKKDLTVFFLTSRHTQHKIVIDTLKEIKKKYAKQFIAASIIGKKWMCLQPNTETMFSGDFSEFCKSLRESDKCEFYLNCGKNSTNFRRTTESAEKNSPLYTEKIIEMCENEKLCPYEVSLSLASRSSVIVCDYYYFFNDHIRENFLKKTGKNIGSSIVIIDEGHNLPSRMRELLTTRISNKTIRLALKECKKYKFEELENFLIELEAVLIKLAEKIINNDEMLVNKEEFINHVNRITGYEEIITRLKLCADIALEDQKRSFLGTIAVFLETWPQGKEGYSRIISRQGQLIMLKQRCLDPSLATKGIISEAHSAILMSGTLSPTEMYKDILGFPENTVCREFTSPFPEKNRMTLIIPKTTTKFTMRNQPQFSAIASICNEITENIPGNCAIFFPSYNLRDEINRHFQKICTRTCFLEQPRLAKNEKEELIEKFKQYKNAVLLGVASGSFGEGIDMPGILKSVIIVGLPLDRPDLETKELINYYDQKFSKGWDYGYILPALTKTMQNAGRCIRSETDKGVIVFLDERYTWPSYFRCFPSDWPVRITLNYLNEIKRFFEKEK